MKRFFAKSLAAVLLCCASFNAHALLIDFDDLPSSIGVVPSVYRGLNWDNFGVLDSPHPAYANSGYVLGTVSPRNVGFNGNGSPAEIRSNSVFDLNSLWLTGAWNDNLGVSIRGFREGFEIYNVLLIVSGFGPTLYNLDFDGIDRVQFQAGGGTLIPGRSGSGDHFAVDDITVDGIQVVPAPGVLALAGLALCAMRLARRR